MKGPCKGFEALCFIEEVEGLDKSKVSTQNAVSVRCPAGFRCPLLTVTTSSRCPPGSCYVLVGSGNAVPVKLRAGSCYNPHTLGIHRVVSNDILSRLVLNP